MALFDIVVSLTDKEKLFDRYRPYLNLDEEKKEADFEYVFSFDGVGVVYRYSKTSVDTLAFETLEIDGKEELHYDFARRTGHVVLKGAEGIRLSSSSDENDNKLSRVKYIKANAILEELAENKTFALALTASRKESFPRERKKNLNLFCGFKALIMTL